MGSDGPILRKDGEQTFSARELEAPITKVLLKHAQAAIDVLHEHDPRFEGIMIGLPDAGFKQLTTGLERMLPSALGDFLIGPDAPVIGPEIFEPLVPEIPPVFCVLMKDCPVQDDPDNSQWRGKLSGFLRRVFPDHYVEVRPPGEEGIFAEGLKKDICPGEEVVIVLPGGSAEHTIAQMKLTEGKPVMKLYHLTPTPKA